MSVMSDELGDRTRFEEAHPPLTLDVIDDDGEQKSIPAGRLPRLMGWTVLLQPWTAPKATKGGILLPDQVSDANDYLTYVFRVVALGPLAFTHPRLRGGARRGVRFEEKAQDTGGEHWREYEWSDFAEGVVPPQPGDWVIVRKFSGIQLTLENVTLKICNDDDILAVIDGPAGWKAYV
jgi:co-chaperonin GroES (HSP10)